MLPSVYVSPCVFLCVCVRAAGALPQRRVPATYAGKATTPPPAANRSKRSLISSSNAAGDAETIEHLQEEVGRVHRAGVMWGQHSALGVLALWARMHDAAPLLGYARLCSGNAQDPSPAFCV